MSVSEVFKKAMFSDSALFSEEFFERRASKLFEKPENARMQLHCWSTEDLSSFQKRPELPDLVGPSLGEVIDINEDLVKVDEYELTKGNALPATRSDSTDDSSQHLACTEKPEVEDGAAILKYSVTELDLSQLKQLIETTNGQFRIFFLRRRHSHARMQITREQLQLLMKECQMFPRLQEILVDFRTHHGYAEELEIAPRFVINQPMMTEKFKAPAFELAYNVQLAACKDVKEDDWVIRQFAVYHKFVAYGPSQCSTWLIAGVSYGLENHVQSYSSYNPYEVNPFELHVTFLNAAIASWREYLSYLFKQVQKMRYSEVIHPHSEKHYCPLGDEIPTDLSKLEDKVMNVATCLEHTLETLKVIIQIYRRYKIDLENYPDPHTPAASLSESDSDGILYKLEEQHQYVSWELRKVGMMLQLTSGIARKISCLSILQCDCRLKLLFELNQEQDAGTEAILQCNEQLKLLVKMNQEQNAETEAEAKTEGKVKIEERQKF